MKHTLGFCAAMVAALMAAPASAAILNGMSFNSTTGIGGITSWPTTPLVATSNANPSQMSSAEGNYGGASLFSLAQSFTATASGNLGSIEIAISGTAPVSFNVALYDPGANDVTDVSTGTYAPGAGGYSNNLFTDTSLQTWTGYTAANSTAGVLKFTLTGADQVPVVAGKSYVFEISATTNPSAMVWFRNGNDAFNYLGGQAYRQRTPLNGNALRDMTIGVAVVPEPSCLALGSLAALALGMVRRRR